MKVFQLGVIFILTALGISAQIAPQIYPPVGGSRSPHPQSPQSMVIETARENNRRARSMPLPGNNEGGLSRPHRRETQLTPSKEARRLLNPAKEEFEKYNAFLSQPETGLIRLFPQTDCGIGGMLIKLDNESCLLRSQLPGFGSAFSFRGKQHQAVAVSDLQLNDKSFVSNGYAIQGIFVELGDIDLESISLKSKGIDFLTGFVPATALTEADKQLREFSKGVNADGYFYRASAQVKEQKTYVLRSIAYKIDAPKKTKTAFKMQSSPIPNLPDSGRADVIIAFRVVRLDLNGSATLLWKQLQKKDSPTLVLPEN